MPYISQLARKIIDLSHNTPTNLNAGELNYKITSLLVDYLETAGLNYQAINDILGALEGAKLEFYRRIAAPYEDEKMAKNGDVY